MSLKSNYKSNSTSKLYEFAEEFASSFDKINSKQDKTAATATSTTTTTSTSKPDGNTSSAENHDHDIVSTVD